MFFPQFQLDLQEHTEFISRLQDTCDTSAVVQPVEGGCYVAKLGNTYARVLVAAVSSSTIRVLTLDYGLGHQISIVDTFYQLSGV